MSLSPEQITLSHTIDDAEKMRTKARRTAKEIDLLIPDLRHAIEKGRTAAALDMLITINAYNLTVLDAVKRPR